LKRVLRLGILAIVLLALAYQGWRLWRERDLPPPEALRDVRTTDHFVIRTNLRPSGADHQARTFEAFRAWFEENYFPVRAPARLPIYAFADSSSYSAYCSAYLPRTPPFGFYHPKLRILVFEASTGLGTATHELVHDFTVHGMRDPPPEWINEGFSAFFEKLIGHFDERGKLVLTVGYFHPSRDAIVKRDVDALDLERLTQKRSVDQNHARSFMLFLHRREKLTPFIRRVATGTQTGDGVRALEEVYGKPLPEIESEWRAWVRAQPLDDDVALVGRSAILTTEDWASFWAQSGGRLVFDPKERRYRPR